MPKDKETLLRLTSGDGSMPINDTKTSSAVSQCDDKSQGASVPAHIVGARFGSAKNSGLLAKDMDCATINVPRDDVLLPAVGGEDYKAINDQSSTGRNIYGFQLGKISKEASTSLNISRTSRGLTEPSKPFNNVPNKKPIPKGMLGVKGVSINGSQNDIEKYSHVTEKGDHHKDHRRALRPKIGGKAIVSSDSSLDSNQSSTEEDEDDDDENKKVTEKPNNTKARKKISKRRWKGSLSNFSNHDMVEEYFSAHHGQGGPTSNHTLKKMSCPKIDQATMQHLLDSATPFYNDTCALLLHHQSLYQYWLQQLSNGFNILLYGLGSKRNLLDNFRQTILSSSCHIVVNGFFPGTTLKHILAMFTCDLLEHTTSFKSHVDQCQFICSSLCQGKRNKPIEVFLLIHNIDGPNLRGDKAQTALSLLSKCPHIHLLASIDHINAPLIWDQVKLSRFNWVWHDCTTFAPYKVETSYENSLMIRQSGTLALSSLTHVVMSLTPNARGIFELLARYQLDHQDEASYIGLAFNDLYLQCREKFLVNSDMTLRAQLTEFRDHKLVRSKKGNDGTELLQIPVDVATLTQFLDKEFSNN